MHEDLDMEASVEELNALEEKFTNIVKERVAGNPELKFVFLVNKTTLMSFLLSTVIQDAASQDLERCGLHGKPNGTGEP